MKKKRVIWRDFIRPLLCLLAFWFLTRFADNDLSIHSLGYAFWFIVLLSIVVATVCYAMATHEYSDDD